MSAAKGSPMPRTEMDALLLGRLDELADVEPNTRSRSLLGIILSILVLLLISSLIVAAIVIMNPMEIANLGAHRHTARQAISLEEAFLGALNAREPMLQWLPSSAIQRVAPKPGQRDELLYEDSKNLYLVALPLELEPFNGSASSSRNHKSGPDADGASFQRSHLSVLVSNTSLLTSIDYQGYKLSPSKRYLLLWTSKRKQFRSSFTAKYFLYDLQLDLISLLATSPEQEAEGAQADPPTSKARGQPAARHNYYESLDSASAYLDGDIDQRRGSEMGAIFDEPVRFQLVDWFATSDGDDSLMLVQNNDIFLLNNMAAIEGGDSFTSGQPVRLTHTGQPGVVFNGIPDWLYEEEILGESQALQVSPDGRRLAYLSFNDSQVAQMPFTMYGSERSILPQIRHVRYPKAGQANPTVDVHVVHDLSQMSSSKQARPLKLKLPAPLEDQQHYINRLVWLTNDKLGLIWSSRSQTESRVIICSPQDPSTSASSWTCASHVEWSARDGWLDIGDDLFPADQDHFLLIKPFLTSDKGAFKHIALVSLKEPGNLFSLTSGEFEVLAINGVNPEQTTVFFTSTLEGEPGQRHLRTASMSQFVSSDPACITCIGHYEKSCLYNQAKLSPSSRHYIFHCDGPDVPRVELRRNPRPESGLLERLLWVVEDNRELRDKLASTKAMPVQVRLQVPISGTRYSANVLLLLPPPMGPQVTFQATRSAGLQRALNHWSGQPAELVVAPAGRRARRTRPEEAATSGRHHSGQEEALEALSEYISQLPNTGQQQYPMLVDVYAGPNSQRIDHKFNIHLGHYFASNRRTVYAMIDGRGSGLEGSRRAFELRHRLGTVEVQDQIDVTSRLARGVLAPIVDSTKVGVWGWSYGGYAAAMALARSNAAANERYVENLRSELAAKMNRQPNKSAKAAAPLSPVLPPLRGVFECAASVAPVTDWTLYDTAYTEKYMSSPWQTNQAQFGNASARGASSANADKQAVEEHYRRASLLEQIGAINRKRFLLVHGTADDNVHFQQSIMLMKELIKRNIMFETRLYPDRDHSISGRAEKLHLGYTLSNFFAECFDMAY